MEPTSEFSKIVGAEDWFKVLTFISAVVLVFALFRNTYWIDNKQAILLSSGLLFFSLGYWKNYKGMTKFQQAGLKLLTYHWRQRKADTLGIALEGIGIFLLGFAVWSFFF